ncbi:succinate dehydrogenase assembly factor 4, mitochondrial isoform X1 [Otolemur garnettii]|uniref:succinate dehydrogenase assembly factor 4, mitochondrial isoform X1 n=1 Tax=Otolemur garnettii TaxID=30611 RepID=UPI000C7F2C50|nr:succinate dehydrogenase assembly factor 4, mitochondrial isoform X1 [Otolemur garnettii]
MSSSRLPGLLSRALATARTTRFHSLRKTSSSPGEKSELIKQSLKKPKLPEGRFDAPEDSHLEKEPLESESSKAPPSEFPDDINPVTKEKGGPRGPEPTRYGDWERKGRCIDF